MRESLEVSSVRELSQFIQGLGSESDFVVPILIDNKSALQAATSTLMSTTRTRHFKTRFFWLRHAARDFVKLVYVNTKFNRADALTKPLSRKVIDFMMRRISMSDLQKHYDSFSRRSK